MKQEEKELLLKDLCARLPYGVKINLHNAVFEVCFIEKEDSSNVYVGLKENDKNTSQQTNLSNVKPYLRPMSSMTEEEENDLKKITWQFHFDRKFNSLWVGAADDGGCMLSEMTQIITYLISHHFDYCGLIENGLALEAPKDMYNN